jgi:selT/selW/selH-like putative selenoprotein
LAAEIKKELGVEPKLIRGGGGIFDVMVENKKIFSKHDEGRFPEEKEILAQLRKMQAK